MTIFDELLRRPYHDEPPEFDAAEASGPTSARPGSAAKLAEFQRRINAGEELWHDGDADLRTMRVE